MVTDQDKLAIEFQNEEDSSKRNKIYKTLRKHYLPWAYARYNHFTHKRDAKEFMCLYDYYLLHSLELWDPTENTKWTTYAFNWINKAYYETIRMYVDIDNRYMNIDDVTKEFDNEDDWN